uniref:Thymidylate synthase n=1 Tax=viral metagenome TaxID=1070528 RepID=A0A6C0JP98_9ZZZZ
MVELLEVFGDDLTVVNAARVSFAKESHYLSGGDARLIQYLADHNHITPFFHPQARFRLKMPIFVAREWFRHQIGFARNEISRRYVDSDPEFWLPTELRERDINKKQGSKDTIISNNEYCIDMMQKHNQQSLSLYRFLLNNKVCPEQARAVLPQCMMTEFIETGSLAAYARLYKLRTDPNAQREIQDLASSVGELLAERFPISWSALTSCEVE